MSILACSAGFAITCPAVQAEDISITENTTWANDDAHAADTTTVSGATLKINHEPAATVGTTYNYGSIHVTNNGTLELETWTGGGLMSGTRQQEPGPLSLLPYHWITPGFFFRMVPTNFLAP